jgi:hypothetical protein
MHDFLGHLPTNLNLRRVCAFPEQGVKFRACADYGGKPWFDYCWLRVADDQPGADLDLQDSSEKRMLAQIWAFTKWKGRCYVFVELFQRVHREEGVRPHPMLRKYKYFVYRNDGRLVHPFYAFDVSSIIATAVVFPDPDFETGPSVVEKQILYQVTFKSGVETGSYLLVLLGPYLQSCLNIPIKCSYILPIDSILISYLGFLYHCFVCRV